MTTTNPTSVLNVVNSISGGGAENVMMVITSKLHAASTGIHLCAINNDFPSEESVAIDEISTLDRKWKGGIGETVKALLEFRKLVRRLRPKVMVANCELPELYVAIAAPRKTKIIAVEHTSNPWAGRKILGTLIRTILRFRHVYWVTVSSDAKPIWCGSKSPQYIANPVLIEESTPLKNSQGKNAVFIGRLRAEKRPDWLISSAIESGLDVDIFGDGNQGEMLRSKYSAESKMVRFHGYVTNPWGSVGKNSIVVVPSEYEGDGMVVAEAILRGHPVLLADNSDLRRFALPDENYFLDQGLLTVKLKEWKESPHAKFQVPGAIVKSLHKARNIDTIVQQWESLLTNLQR
jgi:glycosyltransferase involved in cell wall biosynthesis